MCGGSQTSVAQSTWTGVLHGTDSASLDGKGRSIYFPINPKSLLKKNNKTNQQRDEKGEARRQKKSPAATTNKQTAANSMLGGRIQIQSCDHAKKIKSWLNKLATKKERGKKVTY